MGISFIFDNDDIADDDPWWEDGPHWQVGLYTRFCYRIAEMVGINLDDYQGYCHFTRGEDKCLTRRCSCVEPRTYSKDGAEVSSIESPVRLLVDPCSRSIRAEDCAAAADFLKGLLEKWPESDKDYDRWRAGRFEALLREATRRGVGVVQC